MVERIRGNWVCSSGAIERRECPETGRPHGKLRAELGSADSYNVVSGVNEQVETECFRGSDGSARMHELDRMDRVGCMDFVGSTSALLRTVSFAYRSRFLDSCSHVCMCLCVHVDLRPPSVTHVS